MSKKIGRNLLVTIGMLFLLILSSCTSADLYHMNYPDDPVMQKRMEKEYGDWNKQ